MTKHRTKEAWVEDILDSATQVIDEDGYPNLTMEAIASRSGLSKGGVYRIFKNKKEVALALFRRLHLRLLDFDINEVESWGLSIEETVTRLLFAQLDGEDAEKVERTWIQLLPETRWSESFRVEAQRIKGQLREKYRELIERLVARDGVEVRGAFEGRLKTALDLGVAMMQGMAIQGTEGTPRESRADLLSRFIEMMMAYVIEERR